MGLLLAIGTVEQGAQAIITITQGDTATLQLESVVGDAKAPLDLTGATFTTEIKKNDGTIATFANGQHTANADQTGHRGQFTLALTSSDTTTLMLGSREVLTKVVISGVTTQFHGVAILSVLSSLPTT